MVLLVRVQLYMSFLKGTVSGLEEEKIDYGGTFLNNYVKTFLSNFFLYFQNLGKVGGENNNLLEKFFLVIV